MKRLNPILLAIAVTFLSACGGGSGSNDTGSDGTKSGGNTSGGESGSSGSTGSGTTGGGTGTTSPSYSPYAGGTGRGAVRLKTVTDSNGSVHTLYYNDDPIKAGTLSHEIEDKSFETLTRKYEYSLGSLSKMTVYAIEDSGDVTRDDTVSISFRTIQFEPINDLIVSSADVTRVDKGKTYEYSKTYRYKLDTI